MNALDPHTIDIAKDALREGRPAEVAEIVADQPKTLLVGELVAALFALAKSTGFRYLAMHIHSGLSCSIHYDDLDALAADILACGGTIESGPVRVDGDTHHWRSLVGVVAGVKIDAMSEHIALTPADKRKRTLKRKQQQAEAIDRGADADELRAPGLHVVPGRENGDVL